MNSNGVQICVSHKSKLQPPERSPFLIRSPQKIFFCPPHSSPALTSPETRRTQIHTQMGSTHSSPSTDEDDEDEDQNHRRRHQQPPRTSQTAAAAGSGPHPTTAKILLEQEPEILPCHASASPLSAVGTPRGPHPSIKVWDPCHVLLPPPPPPSAAAFYSDPVTAAGVTEVFLMTHGECEVNLRPDLVTGRWAGAALTGNGERQGRAMAVFLKSQGVRFVKVFSSPLDRAMATAGFVCRVILLNFSVEGSGLKC